MASTDSEAIRRTSPASAGRVQVAVRCKPLAFSDSDQRRVVVRDETTIDVNGKAFKFDKVFPPNCTQADVFDAIGVDKVQNVLQGYNATVMAYGQTGSGKTHTLANTEPGSQGIIPRCVFELFAQIAKDSSHEYDVQLSYVQIYLEKPLDLLCPEKTDLCVRESPIEGVFLQGATEVQVRNAEDCAAFLRAAGNNRKIANTQMNAKSSRSHAIVLLTVSRRDVHVDTSATDSTDHSVLKGKLVLVDLAGSERVKKSGVTGKQHDEAIAINLSLSTLGNVIHALAEPTRYVPFRDSVLTRLLQDSLGGNCQTTLVVTVSTDSAHLRETSDSLQFGQRAMKVTTHAVVNASVDYRALAMRLQAQLDNWESQSFAVRNELETSLHKVIVERDRLSEEVQISQITIESMHQELLNASSNISSYNDVSQDKWVQQLNASQEEVTRLKTQNKRFCERIRALTELQVMVRARLLSLAECAGVQATLPEIQRSVTEACAVSFRSDCEAVFLTVENTVQLLMQRFNEQHVAKDTVSDQHLSGKEVADEIGEDIHSGNDDEDDNDEMNTREVTQSAVNVVTPTPGDGGRTSSMHRLTPSGISVHLISTPSPETVPKQRQLHVQHSAPVETAPGQQSQPPSARMSITSDRSALSADRMSSDTSPPPAEESVEDRIQRLQRELNEAKAELAQRAAAVIHVDAKKLEDAAAASRIYHEQMMQSKFNGANLRPQQKVVPKLFTVKHTDVVVEEHDHLLTAVTSFCELLRTSTDERSISNALSGMGNMAIGSAGRAAILASDAVELCLKIMKKYAAVRLLVHDGCILLHNVYCINGDDSAPTSEQSKQKLNLLLSDAVNCVVLTASQYTSDHELLRTALGMLGNAGNLHDNAARGFVSAGAMQLACDALRLMNNYAVCHAAVRVLRHICKQCDLATYCLFEIHELFIAFASTYQDETSVKYLADWACAICWNKELLAQFMQTGGFDQLLVSSAHLIGKKDIQRSVICAMAPASKDDSNLANALMTTGGLDRVIALWKEFPMEHKMVKSCCNLVRNVAITSGASGKAYIAKTDIMTCAMKLMESLEQPLEEKTLFYIFNLVDVLVANADACTVLLQNDLLRHCAKHANSSREKLRKVVLSILLRVGKKSPEAVATPEVLSMLWVLCLEGTESDSRTALECIHSVVDKCKNPRNLMPDRVALFKRLLGHPLLTERKLELMLAMAKKLFHCKEVATLDIVTQVQARADKYVGDMVTPQFCSFIRFVVEEPAGASAVLETDCLKYVVDLLSHGAVARCHQLVSKVLWAIYSILKLGEEGEAKSVAVKIPPTLVVAVLTASRPFAADAAVANASTAVISVLCCVPDGADLAHDGNILPYLATVFNAHKSEEKVLQNTISALHNAFLRGTKYSVTADIARDLVSILTWMSDPQLVADLITAFRMAVGSNSGRDAFINQGIIPALIGRMTGCAHEQTLESCCEFFRAVGQHNGYESVLIQCGACEAICTVMRAFPNCAELQTAAICALRNLVAPGRVVQLGESGAIELTCLAMKRFTGTTEVLRSASCMLSAVAQVADLQTYFVESGGKALVDVTAGKFPPGSKR
eukprot:TRINITY_DN4763_c0_g1_i2.p1 TRINITY_DN4763_c0_g1~~TRINITY_DN4763_c0_g1_i2.p1  ORF type:complete len:1583 (-),score=398.20 TRINITY_DN4763_c0_g1_i2:53-4801(-)